MRIHFLSGRVDFVGLAAKKNSVRVSIESSPAILKEIERQLSKALADANLWKAKFETEGVARIDEIEREKGKVGM